MNLSNSMIGYLSERQYLIFVLGYDLLRDDFTNSNYSECDIVYEKCNEIIDMFLESDDYHNKENLKYSTYELLEIWLDKNESKIKEIIESEEI